MIALRFFSKLYKALPRCRVVTGTGEMVLVDRNGEVIGCIDEKEHCVKIDPGYEYAGIVHKRLQRAGVPARMATHTSMEQSMKILYDH